MSVKKADASGDLSFSAQKKTRIHQKKPSKIDQD